MAPADYESPGTEETVVGYVPSGWDMFHIGHLNILLRAREKCDRLVVGVVTDEALFQAKGDFSSNKLEVWERVGFEVLFKGDDWRGTARATKLEAELASVGVKVCYFPHTVQTSSTLLRSILTERSA
jgi:glycerol-3-phosphate cytidylyltransferase